MYVQEGGGFWYIYPFGRRRETDFDFFICRETDCKLMYLSCCYLKNASIICKFNGLKPFLFDSIEFTDLLLTYSEMITMLRFLFLTCIPLPIQSFGSVVHKVSRSSFDTTYLLAKSNPFERQPALFSSKMRRSSNFQFDRRSSHSTIQHPDGNLFQPALSFNGLLCILVTLWYAFSSTVTSKSKILTTSMKTLVSRVDVLMKGFIPRIKNDNNMRSVNKNKDTLSTRLSNMFNFLKQASDASNLDIKASTYASVPSVNAIEYDKRNDEIVFTNDEEYSSAETDVSIQSIESGMEITNEKDAVKKIALKVSIPVSQALVNATLEIQGTYLYLCMYVCEHAFGFISIYEYAEFFA